VGYRQQEITDAFGNRRQRTGSFSSRSVHFSAYVAEIEDYGSSSTGRFSEQLCAARIANIRSAASNAYLGLYDADPSCFLALFHGACDPLNRATIAALAGSWDAGGEDENDQHVVGCCQVFWDDGRRGHLSPVGIARKVLSSIS
jgi:hypothetical protein